MMTRRVVVIPDAVRPAWRPSAYRPPPPSLKELGTYKLGEGPNINWMNIGETIMFAASGAGAMYAAPLFPDPVKTIAMVAGVGLIGYAAYTFLGGSDQKKKDNNTPEPFKGATTAQLARISGKFIQPVSGSSESWTFIGQTYPAKVLVTGADPKEDVTFTLQITAKEVGLPLDLLFHNISNEYLAASELVTLKPKGQKGESQEIPFTLSVRLNRWINPKVGVFLSLKKVPVDGAAVLLDTTYVILS